ncbi:MAG: hypothetical protein ACI81R_000401 [Bradymonadia bacterium]|jgi:hypothetical protein
MRFALRLLIPAAILSLATLACGADDAVNSLAGAIRDVSVADAGTDTGEGDETDTTIDTTIDAAIEDTDNPGLDVAVQDDTGGTTTGVDCDEIAACVQQAECATQACLDGCIAEGNSAAQADFAAYYTCLGANCADADENEMLGCQAEFCSDEFTQCTGSSLPSGDADCSTTVECLISCTSPECGDACIEDADIDGANLAVTYYNCGVDNCADQTSAAGFRECLAESCPDEAAACEGGM